MATRDVFAIAYPVHLWAAHWEIFIPNAIGQFNDITTTGPGKIINVEGSVENGFTLFFKRDYIPVVESSKAIVARCLGSVDDALVRNPDKPSLLLADPNPTEEALANDILEQIAQTVPPPPKTLGIKASPSVVP